MCFSAQASFTASAILLVMGAFTLSKNRQKFFIPLALIPLFFSLQQFAEGIVWLNNDYSSLAKNVFLFFALTFWPIWIPISLLLPEKDLKRKTIIKTFLAIGTLTALVSSPTIFLSEIHFKNSSISYLNYASENLWLNLPIITTYSIATIGSLFASTLKKIKIIGSLSAISALTVLLVKFCCFASLWCFWAAITSAFIYFIIKENNSEFEK